MTLGSILVALLFGVVVFLIGCLFDKSPDNRYAGIAGLITFVLVLFGYLR